MKAASKPVFDWLTTNPGSYIHAYVRWLKGMTLADVLRSIKESLLDPAIDLFELTALRRAIVVLRREFAEKDIWDKLELDVCEIARAVFGH